MLFSVRSRMPGRIRLRLLHPFDTDEARGMEAALLEHDFVHRAEAHVANGSLLAVFDPGCEEAVLAEVAAFDALRLPRAHPNAAELHELSLVAEDNRFALEISTIMAWRVLRRLMLPLPLRTAWIIINSFRFVVKGLRCLLLRGLTVEVLDATAIVASLLRGTYDEADVIMLLLDLSEAMEQHVSSRARLALEQGLVAHDNQVIKLVDGQEHTVPLSDVVEGDLVCVRSGMVIPVDGVVEHGEGEADEATMTGEERLVHKSPGASAFAGTALVDGDLALRCTMPPGKARIDAIAQMVEQASQVKGVSESRAERLADSLVPGAFIAFLGILAFTRNIEKALAVLMVDYSCAIKISTPIAVMSAMREAASHGIIVKGGRYLEELAAAETVVFDKTGTLTEANPRLVAVVATDGESQNDVLRLAACIEEHYPHSVARAIVEGARDRGLSHEPELHAEVRYVVAHGIAAEVDGMHSVIGSAHFVFEDEGVPMPEGFADMVGEEAPGAGVVYLARGGKLLGALCVSDPVRTDAANVVSQLRSRGVREVVMLTGDGPAAARRVASELGLTSFFAQVLPEDKAAYVERIQASGGTVVMVGDGINDSPALAVADVSVALADASDIAQAVADVSVRDADLQKLVLARDLSERLMRRIAQRYRLIVGFNTTLIALGVANLIPLTTAATLHNLSTVAIATSNTRPLL
ncbi:MAG: heavy metal translocating P-type ATPase [Atopobiaceae bacterium]|nr:heavy metal translocating P-type ATPase [Atopobiaceae bacterium]